MSYLRDLFGRAIDLLADQGIDPPSAPSIPSVPVEYDKSLTAQAANKLSDLQGMDFALSNPMAVAGLVIRPQNLPRLAGLWQNALNKLMQANPTPDKTERTIQHAQALLAAKYPRIAAKLGPRLTIEPTLGGIKGGFGAARQRAYIAKDRVDDAEDALRTLAHEGTHLLDWRRTTARKTDLNVGDFITVNDHDFIKALGNKIHDPFYRPNYRRIDDFVNLGWDRPTATQLYKYQPIERRAFRAEDTVQQALDTLRYLDFFKK